MLFDLRGRRRRGIQAIYLTLAILMGGGLVLFGIGGEVSGGLVDAITQNQGDVAEQTEERVENAVQATQARPRDPAAWADLAEARVILAGQSEGFNEDAVDPTQAFTAEAREQLVLAARAWDRHLELAGDNPNENLAATIQNAFAALGQLDRAVRAQEIVLDARGDSAGFGDFAKLAALAYQAGQTRKGDLAADRAKELAKDQPKDQREALEASLNQAKAQAGLGAAGGAGGAAGATPAPAPTPSGG